MYQKIIRFTLLFNTTCNRLPCMLVHLYFYDVVFQGLCSLRPVLATSHDSEATVMISKQKSLFQSKNKEFKANVMISKSTQ